jgi:type I restriction enzyme S subunit
MTNGAIVPLQDFCEIVQGGRLKLTGNDFIPDGFPAYGAGGVNGYLEVSEFDRPAVVLSSVGARCGKCFYAEGKWTSLANTQVIFPDPGKAVCKFLWFQLNDETRWHRSGTGQPFIKPSDVKAHRVFLPSLKEQRRIAEVLDRAEALRAKRRAALAQLDTLTQVIFLDMFGDPATHPRGFEIRPVSDYVAAFEGGKSLEAEAGDGAVTRNRVLKVSAVTGMKYNPHESKPVPDSYQPRIEHFVRDGDLLFSRANTSELVGAVAYVEQTPPNILLPDKIWRFVWREPQLVDPLFVWALFQTPHMRHEIGRRATGTSGSMKNISQEKLLGIRTILPDIQEQREFSRRFLSAQRLSRTYQESALSMDSLFTSLQHRAFNGEVQDAR